MRGCRCSPRQKYRLRGGRAQLGEVIQAGSGAASCGFLLTGTCGTLSSLLAGLVVAVAGCAAPSSHDDLRSGDARQGESIRFRGEQLAAAAQANEESVLSVSGMVLYRASDDDLAHLGKWKNLRTLRLLSAVTDRGVRHLKALPQLRTLWIRARVSNDGMRELGSLSELRELHLRLPTPTGEASASPVSDLGLCELGRLSYLRSLHLTFAGTSSAITGARWIDELARLQSLRVLCLDNAESLAEEYLAELGRLSALEELFIAGDARRNGRGKVEVTDAVLRRLGNLRRMRVLHLSDTCVTDDAIAYLLPLSCLTTLSLQSSANFTASGVCHLGGLKELRRLDLTGSGVTNEGLAGITGLRHLEHLALDHTDVGDEGLLHLKGLKQLKWLSLGGCERVTNKGIAHLRGLENLRYLYLCDTQVDRDGVRQLDHLRNLRYWIDGPLAPAGFERGGCDMPRVPDGRGATRTFRP